MKSAKLRNSQHKITSIKLIAFILYFCLPPKSKFVTSLSVKHESFWHGPGTRKLIISYKTLRQTQECALNECVCVHFFPSPHVQHVHGPSISVCQRLLTKDYGPKSIRRTPYHHSLLNSSPWRNKFSFCASHNMA